LVFLARLESTGASPSDARLAAIEPKKAKVKELARAEHHFM
jgi:hypothetical protein